MSGDERVRRNEVTLDSGGGRSRQEIRDEVVIITSDSKPRLGGIAEYLHNVALALADHFRVRVLTTVAGAESLNDGLPFEYQEMAPWARRLPASDGVLATVSAAVVRLGQWFGAVALLRRLLRERPVRLVLIGNFSPATYMWCHACQRLGVEYAVLVYGRELIAPLGRVGHARRVKFIRGASRVYSISSDTTDLIVELGVPRERIEPLVPGIAPEKVDVPGPDGRAVLRGQLGIGDRGFIISICRLMPRKGIDLAIEAFAAVAGIFPGVDFVIVGTGPEEARLRSLAGRLGVGSRVWFLGAVDEAVKYALLADCELFVMPNRRLPDDVEGFGIVFLEAALLGKATIGGRNGGVIDAVEDGVTGLLVDTSKDAAPLCAALSSLLSDSERAARMGRAGRERALTRFQWAHTTRGLIASVPTTPVQVPRDSR